MTLLSAALLGACAHRAPVGDAPAAAGPAPGDLVALRSGSVFASAEATAPVGVLGPDGPIPWVARVGAVHGDRLALEPVGEGAVCGTALHAAWLDLDIFVDRNLVLPVVARAAGGKDWTVHAGTPVVDGQLWLEHITVPAPPKLDVAPSFSTDPSRPARSPFTGPFLVANPPVTTPLGPASCEGTCILPVDASGERFSSACADLTLLDVVGSHLEAYPGDRTLQTGGLQVLRAVPAGLALRDPDGTPVATSRVSREVLGDPTGDLFCWNELVLPFVTRGTLRMCVPYNATRDAG